MSCPSCELDVLDYIIDQKDIELLKRYLSDSPQICEFFKNSEIDISLIPKEVRDVLTRLSWVDT
jgi:hypothetical protein